MIGVARPAVGQAGRRFFDPAFQFQLAGALDIVRRALRRAKRPYVAFSGGKDSLVVAGLVLLVEPAIILHWSDDELEYPETVTLMTDLQDIMGDQLLISRGWATHAGWFRPWRDEPFWRDPLPGTLTAGMDSDDWMAGRGHDLTLLGTRGGESNKRGEFLRAAGPTYRVRSGTGRRCCPLWDWTEDDVWCAIAGLGLPYNLAYDRLAEIGVDRERQRIGPLPLTPRWVLAAGWPEVLARLEARYGARWE